MLAAIPTEGRSLHGLHTMSLLARRRSQRIAVTGMRYEICSATTESERIAEKAAVDAMFKSPRRAMMAVDKVID